MLLVGPALRTIAVALAVVVSSGAITLHRACCLFAAEHVVTCCEQGGDAHARVDVPPCCDELVTEFVSADRVQHGADAVQLVAVLVSHPRMTPSCEGGAYSPSARALPDELSRFRRTSRLLL